MTTPRHVIPIRSHFLWRSTVGFFVSVMVLATLSTPEIFLATEDWDFVGVIAWIVLLVLGWRLAIVWGRWAFRKGRLELNRDLVVVRPGETKTWTIAPEEILAISYRPGGLLPWKLRARFGAEDDSWGKGRDDTGSEPTWHEIASVGPMPRPDITNLLITFREGMQLYPMPYESQPWAKLWGLETYVSRPAQTARILERWIREG